MNYNAPLIITVGQLNRYVKSLLDADENLYNLYLVGEISILPTTINPVTFIFL